MRNHFTRQTWPMTKKNLNEAMGFAGFAFGGKSRHARSQTHPLTFHAC
jgi:hypothetical protein